MAPPIWNALKRFREPKFVSWLAPLGVGGYALYQTRDMIADAVKDGMTARKPVLDAQGKQVYETRDDSTVRIPKMHPSLTDTQEAVADSIAKVYQIPGDLATHMHRRLGPDAFKSSLHADLANLIDSSKPVLTTVARATGGGALGGLSSYILSKMLGASTGASNLYALGGTVLGGAGAVLAGNYYDKKAGIKKSANSYDDFWAEERRRKEYEFEQKMARNRQRKQRGEVIPENEKLKYAPGVRVMPADTFEIPRAKFRDDGTFLGSVGNHIVAPAIEGAVSLPRNVVNFSEWLGERVGTIPKGQRAGTEFMDKITAPFIPDYNRISAFEVPGHALSGNYDDMWHGISQSGMRLLGAAGTAKTISNLGRAVGPVSRTVPKLPISATPKAAPTGTVGRAWQTVRSGLRSNYYKVPMRAAKLTASAATGIAYADPVLRAGVTSPYSPLYDFTPGDRGAVHNWLNNSSVVRGGLKATRWVANNKALLKYKKLMANNVYKPIATAALNTEPIGRALGAGTATALKSDTAQDYSQQMATGVKNTLVNWWKSPSTMTWDKAFGHLPVKQPSMFVRDLYARHETKTTPSNAGGVQDKPHLSDVVMNPAPAPSAVRGFVDGLYTGATSAKSSIGDVSKRVADSMWTARNGVSNQFRR